ncbi:type IV secretory system conjugative DNA transfer family protein [Yeosuana marina]|uniref:type IV secretory system conjugative DNA transfer family protein n=1 Tax=Yeosuana marina TaxID=1565536 RepID=UPI003C7006C9
MNLPMLNTISYAIISMLLIGMASVLFYRDRRTIAKKKYQVHFKIKWGRLKIDNIKRGVSVIGSAGSGKTESVVYNLLQHFSKHGFCGIIHDYKDFELTEMAYPLFGHHGNVTFYTISFDTIHDKVNPIAPRYLPNEESVNELSRVLMENLLELGASSINATTRFFNDAVEGLLAGLIWKLRTEFPKYCTLPHLIALFQGLSTKKLVAFLSSNITSKSMASAFISGIESDKQTAGVKSTLANALKKISSQNIFMVLSEDGVPLDINSPTNPAVISIVNNPKYESAYAPIIATIVHTVIKQMSIRNRMSSFVLMEEAPTIKLPNMHRIPATLRSYDIATVYVMQDKIQNDMLYGDKASKAILSNLSYQFFGKVNDPDTAKYYEQFFELVKIPTKSVSRSNGLSFESRITKGEKEVSKRRAGIFFRLRQGEFIAFADGKDRKVRFKLRTVERDRPINLKNYSEAELSMHFERIYRDISIIFKGS